MTHGCLGTCSQGRKECDCMRWNGTSRPASLDEVVSDKTEKRSLPGSGIVRAIGIVAVLAAVANVAAQVWR